VPTSKHLLADFVSVDKKIGQLLMTDNINEALNQSERCITNIGGQVGQTFEKAGECKALY